MSAQIQSIERAATVLRLLTTQSGRGVAELATELRLPKATVYGILRTLHAVGFVEQDGESGKYQIGPALLHIGLRYLDGNELRLRALRWANTLASQSEESVRIGTPHENVVLVVHNVLRPDDASQTSAVGGLMPLHATALGKALLAHRRDLVTAIAERGLASYTSATITDFQTLRAELDGIADRGWADDVAEFLPNVASISAPIESRHRTVVGAVAISGPVERICADGSPRSPLVGYVMDAARAISQELGWTPGSDLLPASAVHNNASSS